MTVFRILASRTELHLIEAYVRATNSEDAEILFYGALENEDSAIMWTQVFDGSDTEIDSVERVPMITIRFPPAMTAPCVYSAVES